MTFEKAMARLEEIVLGLEEGNLELEKTLNLFEEGLRLFRFCEEQLKGAEGRVMKLVQELDPGRDVSILEE
ncbi:MAG: exodeoxyribonuclease VII small subunit [Syntrophomonadaceae bacterium]|nr:exodeoxyribonuclease VII small subunit [Syntrophomonadaceae bacterium]